MSRSEPHRVDTTRPSLLLRIRNREDTRAWRAFDEIYRPMLLRFAHARGLNDADAEDVVQFCMSAVVGQLETFEYDRSVGRFKSWLRTLVNNRARDLWRKRAAVSADPDAFDRLADNSPRPEEAFEQIWMEEHLRYCLRELRQEVSQRDYQAFEAVAIEQRSPAEVSAELGISRGALYTIKWRLTERVAVKMRALLGADGDDEAARQRSG
ncbi:MAG: sigma-70 family RNA polymerase sigma factor [Planctomycetota bacterium]|nr:MAG: sigma-70 family RNA polymerase sigma factor [Planctomycetota bacterium]